MHEEPDWYVQDELELDVFSLDGPELLDSAREEASGYVDREYPWVGVGGEPAERLPAWLAVLLAAGGGGARSDRAANRRSTP